MRLSLLLVFATTPLILLGQQAANDPFFPKPAYFKRHFGSQPPRFELQPPAHLADYVVGNQLELSLKRYLDLVMWNSSDIAVQQITVDFNKDAVTRAFSVFDPLAIARYSSTRTQSPSSSVLSGAATLNQLTQPLSLQYSQTLGTGTQYNVVFSTTKTSSNSTFSTFNPQLSSSVNFNIVQPLIKGRGSEITRIPISIARSKLKVAGYTFLDQLTQLIAAAENAYWDVISARENLRVQEESMKLADAALKRAEKELELGATSPLEIFQPQANFANAQLAVVQARFALRQTEDALRRQMGADLDPNFRTMPITLTESVEAQAADTTADREAVVGDALRRRPDILALRQNLDVDRLSIRQAVDALRPDLSLTAQYGSAGLGGTYFPGTNLLNPGAPVTPIPGGLADALSGVFGFSHPTYGFGLNLRLPIRDRNAAANYADTLVQRKIDALRERTAEENARLQVLASLNQLESSKESVKIAKIARDLARKRVDADQKRYELGTTTLFFVLASQTDLTNAEANLVNQYIAYRRNQTTVLQRSGRLLEDRGIVVK